MSVNFGHEIRAFEFWQKQVREEYISAGMTEEQIQAMYEFDKKQFWRDMAYYRRIPSLCNKEIYMGFFVPYDFCVMCGGEDNNCDHSSYWWIEEIENTKLYHAVIALPKAEIELLNMVVICGYTQKYMANVWNVCPNVISKRLKKIYKKLYSRIR